jgi:hypothetical protein
LKLLKFVGLGLLALVLGVVLVGLFLPRTWRVERSVTVNAPPAPIYARVNTLARWPEWAAWNKEMDPKVVYTHTGPAAGVGASWAWDGPIMGKGAMTITRSEPDAGVWIDEKIESDEVNAKGSITWRYDNGQTHVTWVDEGTLPPVIGGYAVGMIETMLGQHFQTGLDHLKAAAEAEVAAQAKAEQAPVAPAPVP